MLEGTISQVADEMFYTAILETFEITFRVNGLLFFKNTFYFIYFFIYLFFNFKFR